VLIIVINIDINIEFIVGLKKIDLLKIYFFYVIETIIMNVQGLWFMLILILLLLSLCLPGAFLGAIIVFYVPIILGLLYMFCQLMGPLCFTVTLISLGLFLV